MRNYRTLFSKQTTPLLWMTRLRAASFLGLYLMLTTAGSPIVGLEISRNPFLARWNLNVDLNRVWLSAIFFFVNYHLLIVAVLFIVINKWRQNELMHHCRVSGLCRTMITMVGPPDKWPLYNNQWPTLGTPTKSSLMGPRERRMEILWLAEY